MPILQTPAAPIAPGVDRTLDATPGPAAIYEALQNQRSVLQEQLNDLTSERADLIRQVRNAGENGLTGPIKTGLEDRIASIDRRISGVDQQVALVDAQVAKAAAIPGAVVPHVDPPRSGPPEEAFVLGGLFMIIIGLPLSIAFARRIWKRTATVVQSVPAELMARIQRIEHSVETSGLEIERIGEGQRFITKLFSEKLPALQAKNEEPRS